MYGHVAIRTEYESFLVYVQPPTFWYCTGIEVIEIKTQYPTQICTLEVSTIDRLGAVSISVHVA